MGFSVPSILFFSGGVVNANHNVTRSLSFASRNGTNLRSGSIFVSLRKLHSGGQGETSEIILILETSEMSAIFSFHTSSPGLLG